VTEQLATQIAIEAIFYTSAGFVVAVSLAWPWWKSQLGWTIMAKTLALMIAVFPAMLVYWLGETLPHWLEWLSIVALWCIPPILIWRAVVIWRMQRRGLQQR
jgi:hypothetical protein